MLYRIILGSTWGRIAKASGMYVQHAWGTSAGALLDVVPQKPGWWLLWGEFRGKFMAQVVMEPA